MNLNSFCKTNSKFNLNLIHFNFSKENLGLSKNQLVLKSLSIVFTIKVHYKQIFLFKYFMLASILFSKW